MGKSVKEGATEAFNKVRPEAANLTAAALVEGFKFGLRVLFTNPKTDEDVEAEVAAEQEEETQ